MDAAEESGQLTLLVERLAQKFPWLHRDVIAAAVRDAEAGMWGAPIRDFVPVLVEKQARDWLRSPSVAERPSARPPSRHDGRPQLEDRAPTGPAVSQ